jgi:L-asparaginase II
MWMQTPLVVEVTRGSHIESIHEVDVAVVGADGKLEQGWGDSHRDVLPRSAIKPIQAMPLVESGAADAARLTPKELALACSSHNGEAEHVALVGSWLDRIDAAERFLECGAHAPLYRGAADDLLRSGVEFSSIHNNCSGKHTGFLTLCAHQQVDPTGYISPGHRLQTEHITPAIEDLCGLSLTDQTPAVDGCGIPVWAVSLDRLAAGWARLSRRGAGQRLIEAMIAEPFLVAGTDQACTQIMTAGAGSVAVKTGAEGVYCAVVPGQGLAVALKVRDGNGRASNVAIEWLLNKMGAVDTTGPTILRNLAGTEIGEIRVRRA